MARLTDLPNELLDMLVKHLEAKIDLCSVCLVSKRFQDVAERELYRNIQLHFMDARSLLRTLTTNKRLGTHIRMVMDTSSGRDRYSSRTKVDEGLLKKLCEAAADSAVFGADKQLLQVYQEGLRALPYIQNWTEPIQHSIEATLLLSLAPNLESYSVGCRGYQFCTPLREAIHSRAKGGQVFLPRLTRFSVERMSLEGISQVPWLTLPTLREVYIKEIRCVYGNPYRTYPFPLTPNSSVQKIVFVKVIVRNIHQLLSYYRALHTVYIDWDCEGGRSGRTFFRQGYEIIPILEGLPMLSNLELTINNLKDGGRVGRLPRVAESLGSFARCTHLKHLHVSSALLLGLDLDNNKVSPLSFPTLLPTSLQELTISECLRLRSNNKQNISVLVDHVKELLSSIRAGRHENLKRIRLADETNRVVYHQFRSQRVSTFRRFIPKELAEPEELVRAFANVGVTFEVEIEDAKHLRVVTRGQHQTDYEGLGELFRI